MKDQPKSQDETHPLADIDQLVHAPARLTILALLYVVTKLDYVFLKNQSGLTWGNLATHLKKLEEAGYVEVLKGYQGKKPQSMIQLTTRGREAFRDYKRILQEVLDDLPD
jgi:DNA-binding MarR family transcriptional regulator